MLFKMGLEPHSPRNPDKPCYECVLSHGPMCLDRSFCRFRETGKTWKKCGDCAELAGLCDKHNAAKEEV